MEEEISHIFKSNTKITFIVVLIGDASVGKTFLLNRYITNSIPKIASSTIGVEFASKAITLEEGVHVKAQLWDTAGQEKYRAMTAAYSLIIKISHYRKSVGALIVYDITRQSTFESVPKWLKELRVNAEPDIVIMMVGNKVDMCNKDPALRQVDKEEAKKFALQEGIMFEETSAIENVNVKTAFEILMKRTYTHLVYRNP